jgi:hypothetical protein
VIDEINKILSEEIDLIESFGIQFQNKTLNSEKERILFTLIKRNHYNLRAINILRLEFIKNHAYKTPIISIVRTLLSDFISFLYLLDAFNDEKVFLSKYDRLNTVSVEKLKRQIQSSNRNEILDNLKKEYPSHFTGAKISAIKPSVIVKETNNYNVFSNSAYKLYDQFSDIIHFNKTLIDRDDSVMNFEILDGIIFTFIGNILLLRCFSGGIEYSEKIDQLAIRMLQESHKLKS